MSSSPINLDHYLWPKGKSVAEPDLMPSVKDSDGDVVDFYDEKRKTTQATVVDLGDSPNSNNGDPLRTAFAKINNFIEASYWWSDGLVQKHNDHDSDFNELFTTFNIVDDRLRVTAQTVFDSDVIIEGNLTTLGNTTNVLTKNLQIDDSVIVLNYGQPSPLQDSGIIFQRYDSDASSATNWNGYLAWDESGDRFVLGETSDSGNEINPNISMRYQEWQSGTFWTYDATNTLRSTETYGANNVNTIVGNYEIDATGDITFDADGNNFIFQNGAGADTSTVTFADDANWTQTFPGDVYWQVTGDDIYFQGTTANEQIRFNLGATTQTIYASDNLTLDAVGDITFDADGNDFVFRNGAGADASTVTFANDGNWTQTFPGDVYWQVTGDDIYFQGTTLNEQIRFTMGTTEQSVKVSDDLRLQSGGRTENIILGDTSTTDIVVIGEQATVNAAPFVIRYNTTDSIWDLTGDGTGRIDGGTF